MPTLTPGHWWRVHLRTRDTTVFKIWINGHEDIVAQGIGDITPCSLDDLNMDETRYMWVKIEELPRSLIYQQLYNDKAKEVRKKELDLLSLNQLLVLAANLGIDTSKATNASHLKRLIMRKEVF